MIPSPLAEALRQVEELQTYAMHFYGTEFGGLIERDKVLAILRASSRRASPQDAQRTPPPQTEEPEPRFGRPKPMTDERLRKIAEETAHKIEKATQHPPFADICSTLVERFIYDAMELAQPTHAPTPDLDIDWIIREIAELPDRTSPDDWPEAMLVTADELTSILRSVLGASTSSPIVIPPRQFTDGGPGENKARFCHYCCGKIVTNRKDRRAVVSKEKPE